jgi:hypothetical protein
MITSLANPNNACPSCGHRIDSALRISNPSEPKPDEKRISLSVCAHCCGVLVMESDESLRALTDEEWARVPWTEKRKILKCQKSVRHTNQRRAAGLN